MRLLCGFFIILGYFAGCSGSSEQVATPKRDKDYELVNHLTKNVIEPKLQDMERASRTLNDQLLRTCSGKEKVSLEQLRATWTELTAAFHYTEVFLYGPLLIDDESKIDDENTIKERIYSLQKPELQEDIEYEIDDAFEDPGTYVLQSTPEYYGIDALEYILFESLSDEEFLWKDARECPYLRLVATDLKQTIGNLVSTYTLKVRGPLATGEGRTRVRKYLFDLTKGKVTFTDKVLKDRKLAVPLGIELENGKTFECEQGVDCHTLFIEHSQSGYTKQAIENSLQAINDAYYGESRMKKAAGFGYADYLSLGKGAKKLSAMPGVPAQILSEWSTLPSGAEFVEKVGKFDGKEDSDNPVFQRYKLIQVFTSWLKTGFIDDMNAELPGNVQGDND